MSPAFKTWFNGQKVTAVDANRWEQGIAEVADASGGGGNDAVATAIGTPASPIQVALDARYPSKNALVYNVLDYGAIAGGTAVTNTPAIQSALIAARDAGGGTVTFPPGVYAVNAELRIYQGTTLMMNGAELRRDHNGYTFLNGDRGAMYSGYAGNGNITLRGGIMNANGNVYPSKASTFCMGHASDVLFDQVTFRNAANSHAIECNASRRVTVRNCRFEGMYRVNGDADNFSEAIQLDIAMPGGFGAFGAYDGTPCRDIRVEGCWFGASPTAGVTPVTRGVGSHGSAIDAPAERVTIRGCTFEGLLDVAIRPYNWNSLLVDGNWCFGGGSFVAVNTPIVGDGTSDNTKTIAGVQTGASVPNRDHIYRGNTYSGTSASCAFWFVGSATGPLVGFSVQGNSMRGTGPASGGLVSMRGCQSLLVTGNTVTDAETVIVPDTVALSTDVMVDGNRAARLRANGIFFAGVAGGKMTNNTVTDAGLALDNAYSGLRLSSTCTNVTISGNTIQSSSATGAHVKNALYIAGGSGIIRIGNNWAGARAVAALVDTSTTPVIVGEIGT